MVRYVYVYIQESLCSDDLKKIPQEDAGFKISINVFACASPEFFVMLPEHWSSALDLPFLETPGSFISNTTQFGQGGDSKSYAALPCIWSCSNVALRRLVLEHSAGQRWHGVRLFSLTSPPSLTRASFVVELSLRQASYVNVYIYICKFLHTVFAYIYIYIHLQI